MWTKVNQTTNAPEYAIRTEAATAIARGTEFGVRIQSPTPGETPASTTVLTVKEGAVEFSNSHGRVEVTAMSESTASADTAPSQPVRLKNLKTFVLAPGREVIFAEMSSMFDFVQPMYRMVYPEWLDWRKPMHCSSATRRGWQSWSVV